MSSDKATIWKVINAAAEIYASSGASELSLRAVTNRAGVNLASVNYYFQTKEALVKAMIVEEVAPTSIGRLELLQHLEANLASIGSRLRPTHVMACLTLPLIAQITSPLEPGHRTALLFRMASDETPFIREALRASFHHIVLAYINAFQRAASGLSPASATRRAMILCGEREGTTSNCSVSALCARLIQEPGVTLSDVLSELGSMAEDLLSKGTDSVCVNTLVAETIDQLGATPQMNILRHYFPISSSAGSANQ